MHRDRPPVFVGELAERAPRFGALADRTDRVGRHQRDPVVHAVRHQRVAETEPFLVVAQREVRQRVDAVLLDDEPRPLPRQRPVRRQPRRDRRAEQQPEQRQRDDRRRPRAAPARRAGRCCSAARSSSMPTSRSETASSIFVSDKFGVPQRDTDRSADDRDHERRRARRPMPRRHDDGFAGAAKSSRWTTQEPDDQQRDDRLFDVETLGDVADDGDEQQHVREDPGVALARGARRGRAGAGRFRRSRPTRSRPRALRSGRSDRARSGATPRAA